MIPFTSHTRGGAKTPVIRTPKQAIALFQTLGVSVVAPVGAVQLLLHTDMRLDRL